MRMCTIWCWQITQAKLTNSWTFDSLQHKKYKESANISRNLHNHLQTFLCIVISMVQIWCSRMARVYINKFIIPEIWCAQERLSKIIDGPRVLQFDVLRLFMQILCFSSANAHLFRLNRAVHTIVFTDFSATCFIKWLANVLARKPSSEPRYYYADDTMQIANVDVEKVFFPLSPIKTKTRNQLHTKMAHALLIVTKQGIKYQNTSQGFFTGW